MSDVFVHRKKSGYQRDYHAGNKYSSEDCHVQLRIFKIQEKLKLLVQSVEHHYHIYRGQRRSDEADVQTLLHVRLPDETFRCTDQLHCVNQEPVRVHEQAHCVVYKHERYYQQQHRDA